MSQNFFGSVTLRRNMPLSPAERAIDAMSKSQLCHWTMPPIVKGIGLPGAPHTAFRFKSAGHLQIQINHHQYGIV
jgi:hypothetical protein